jgi:hypothetical protein
MVQYEFTTYLACAVAVFVLISCLYRKHVRSKRLFLWAMGLFGAGLMLGDFYQYIQPPMGVGSFPPANLPFLGYLSKWLLYAAIPLFFLACWGTDRAFAQCSHCGYDLTGNNSGVCPECGKTLSSASDGK